MTLCIKKKSDWLIGSEVNMTLRKKNDEEGNLECYIILTGTVFQETIFYFKYFHFSSHLQNKNNSLEKQEEKDCQIKCCDKLQY